MLMVLPTQNLFPFLRGLPGWCAFMKWTFPLCSGWRYQGWRCSMMDRCQPESLLNLILERKELKWWERDFLGGPVVKIPCSQCRGPGFNPWSENYVHMLKLRDYTIPLSPSPTESKRLFYTSVSLFLSFFFFLRFHANTALLTMRTITFLLRDSCP